jgi:hypothetical protein
LLIALQHKPDGGVVYLRLSKPDEIPMTLKAPFATALILAALATSSIAGDKLNANELRGLAPGKYAVSIYGLVKLNINLQSSGSITGTTSKKKTDSGVWSVNGEKLCIRFNRWLKGKQRCTALSGNNGTYSGGGLYIRKI